MSIFRVEDCGKGWMPDPSPEELQPGAWSFVRNMRARDGYMEQFAGLSDVFTATSVVPYWLCPFNISEDRYWIHAGTARVFADGKGVRTDITPTTPFSGSIDDRWTGGPFGGNLIVNNRSDVPHYWNGVLANKLTPLPGWTSNHRAKFVRPFKNMLVAGYISKAGVDYPHMVKVSHPADPGSVPPTWDHTDTSKIAFEADVLSKTGDVLVDALELGSVMILYKERSMHVMTFVGGQYLYTINQIPNTHGLLARGCVVAIPQGHVALTNGDVILFNGQSAQSIADQRVRRTIFADINPTYAGRSFVCANRQRSEVLICYPSGSSTTCNKAAVWNWVENKWGQRDLPNITYGNDGQVDPSWAIPKTWDMLNGQTWDSLDGTPWNDNGYSGGEDRLLLCRASAITAFDVGSTDLGVPIQSVLQQTGMDLGDPDTMKLIRGIRPKIDSSASAVQIQVGASMTPDGSITWSPSTSFQVGSEIKADIFSTQGRFMAVKLSKTDGAVWRARSYGIDVVGAGGY